MIFQVSLERTKGSGGEMKNFSQDKILIGGMAADVTR